MPKEIIIFYIPFPNSSSAKKTGKLLLEEKLAGCIQTFPVQSSFPWNHKIENSRETILLVKTLIKRTAQVRKRVLEQHPYKTPCLLHFKTWVNPDYYHWLKQIID